MSFAAADSSVVCIDLSDSEDEQNASDFGSDSQPELPASSNVPSTTVESFEFEPDEEPPVEFAGLSHSQILGARAAAESLSGIIRPADDWELVLILDHREILSRQNRDILERKLLERNVTCEVRALNVGDMQWVAKRHRDGAVDGAAPSMDGLDGVVRALTNGVCGICSQSLC